MLSPEAAREKWPLLRVDDIQGAAWLPDDGKIEPRELTIALAKGARLHGAGVFEGVRVTRILTRDGRATGVESTHGTVRAEHVVLCFRAGRGGGATLRLRAPYDPERKRIMA